MLWGGHYTNYLTVCSTILVCFCHTNDNNNNVNHEQSGPAAIYSGLYALIHEYDFHEVQGMNFHLRHISQFYMLNNVWNHMGGENYQMTNCLSPCCWCTVTVHAHQHAQYSWALSHWFPRTFHTLAEDFSPRLRVWINGEIDISLKKQNTQTITLKKKHQKTRQTCSHLQVPPFVNSSQTVNQWSDGTEF